MTALSYLDISKSALKHNLEVFREIVGTHVKLGIAIKGNAYGHGLVEVARALSEIGVDYFYLNAAFEAEQLRQAGIKTPLLMIGYTPLSDLKSIVELDGEVVVYNLESLKALAELKKKVKIHLKIETGNHRQGILLEDLPDFIEFIKRYESLKLQGVSTHFADIEDDRKHHYAHEQLEIFDKAIGLLEEEGLAPHLKHCANTAATLLMPETYFDLVRVGIGIYGLWPSPSVKNVFLESHPDIKLKPVLSWKTLVAQMKPVKKGDLIGYGCTYQMPHDGQIAVLPVGYYDGYSRALSNKGEVLIRGKRAPVIGRVCMNMIMVDVTGIPDLKLEEEVVLIGRQGDEAITAEEMAAWQDTINYEVVTRIGAHVERRVVK